MIVCVERKAAGVRGRPCASPASMSAVGGAVSVTATCWMGECPTESLTLKIAHDNVNGSTKALTWLVHRILYLPTAVPPPLLFCFFVEIKNI